MTAAKATDRQRRARGSGSEIHYDAKRGRHYAKVTLADGKRKTLYGKTEREVEKKREDAVRALEGGLPIPGDRLTLGEFLDEWLLTVDVDPEIKRQTYRSYEGLVRVHIKPALGRESLAKLSVDRVKRFHTAKLKAGSSARRVDMMRAVLRIALGEAESRGLVQRNVAKLAKVNVRNRSRIVEALEPDDTSRLLEAAASERSAPLFTLLVTTGLRLGEGLALRWRDVDLEDGWIHVRHTLEKIPGEPWRLVELKTESSRRDVPLTPPALEALRFQQQRQLFERRRATEDLWLDNDLVFANERGDATAARGVEDAFKRSLAKAQLDTTHRVHDLRHSAATYLHALGVDPVVIMAIMGHSTLQMTQRYAHVGKAMLEVARDRLATLFTSLPTTTADAR